MMITDEKVLNVTKSHVTESTIHTKSQTTPLTHFHTPGCQIFGGALKFSYLCIVNESRSGDTHGRRASAHATRIVLKGHENTSQHASGRPPPKRPISQEKHKN